MKNYKDGKNKHDYDSLTIDTIEDSQLKSASNNVDVRAISEAPQKDSMTAFSGEDKNYDAETKGNLGKLEENYSECNRFAKRHDVPASVKIQGQKSSQ